MLAVIWPTGAATHGSTFLKAHRPRTAEGWVAMGAWAGGIPANEY